MPERIFIFSKWLAQYFGACLFLISCVFYFQKRTPGYLKSLSLYCFVNVASEVIVYLYPVAQAKTYLVFTLFEGLYFSYLLGFLIRNKKIKKIAVWLPYMLPAYTLWYFLKHRQIPPFNNVVLLESVILMTTCMAYFKETLTSPTPGYSEKDPAFWIVTGVLFYFGMQIPTLIISAYFIHAKLPALSHAFYSVNNYSLLVTYCSFLTALICKTQRTY
jgi:hypothetical protein